MRLWQGTIHGGGGIQGSAVRPECGTVDWFTIKKGVRQGCILSSALFNIYTETVTRELLDDDHTEPFDLLYVGSKMVGHRYADDAAMISESRSGLKKYDLTKRKEQRLWSENECIQDECYGSGQSAKSVSVDGPTLGRLTILSILLQESRVMVRKSRVD